MGHLASHWCITQRAWARHVRERGKERRKEVVFAGKKRETERWVRRARVRPPLFHSCKRCACNVNSLHPSRFAKNRGSVEGRVSLAELKRSKLSFFLSHIQAQEMLLEMRLMWAARTEKHKARWGTPRVNQKREKPRSASLSESLSAVCFKALKMSHLQNKHKQGPAYLSLQLVALLLMEKLHYARGAYLRRE